MKYLLGVGLLALLTSCTTLENRRDLYSPDVELYPPKTHTTTVRTTTTTTTTRGERRVTAPVEPVETTAPPLPGQ